MKFTSNNQTRKYSMSPNSRSAYSIIVAAIAVTISSVSLLGATQSTLRVVDEAGNGIALTDSGTLTYLGTCNETICPTTAGTKTASHGVIMWGGTIGRFSLGPVSARFTPVAALPFNLSDIQVTAANTSTGAGSLHAYFTTTGVEGAGGHYSANGFSNATGSVTYTYSADFDNTNATVGTSSWPGAAHVITSGTCTDASCTFQPDFPTGGPTGNPFSLTNDVSVNLPGGSMVSNDYSVLEFPGSLGLTCAASTTGTVGVVYSDSLVAMGGVPAYQSYALTSGALPTGLTLNLMTGVISGTPQASGAFNFGAKVTDSANATATTIAPNCTVNIAPPSATGGGGTTAPYTTYTQGGWGAVPHGNNPGYVLTRNFGAVYPSGVAVGGMYKLTFTTAAAVINFLPMGTTAGRLTSNASNPTKSIGGVLAGQVLALQLSVDFSNRGITRPGLALLHIATGKAATATVGDALACANAVLGGGPLPSGFSLSDIVSILDSINNNFDNGTTNHGYLY
jgi:hypothetical protein